MSEAPSDRDEPRDGVAALAEALRAEHAAVHGYEFMGGAAGDEDRRARALAVASEHKAARAELRQAMVERGGTPPAVETTYPLPSDRDGQTLDDFAVGVENTCGRTALWLTSAEDTGLRVMGARLLQEATVRALEWGGELDALPGFEGG